MSSDDIHITLLTGKTAEARYGASPGCPVTVLTARTETAAVHGIS